MHTVQLPASAGAQCFHIDLTNETPLTIAAIVIQALKRGNITEVTFVSSSVAISVAMGPFPVWALTNSDRRRLT